MPCAGITPVISLNRNESESILASCSTATDGFSVKSEKCYRIRPCSLYTAVHNIQVRRSSTAREIGENKGDLKSVRMAHHVQ